MNPILFTTVAFDPWNKFYGNEEKTIYKEPSFLYVDKKNQKCFVTCTNFKNLSPNGTIRFSQVDADTKLLVYMCTFFSCIASDQYGAAIYLFNDGSVVQIMNYITQCQVKGSYYGHHCYVSPSDNASSNNLIVCTSIAQCGQYNQGQNTLNLEDGAIIIKGVNISKINAISGAALSINSPDTNPEISFCNFADNTNPNGYLIRTQGNWETYILKTNIINNNCQGNAVIQEINGVIKVDKCAVINNQKQYNFQVIDDGSIIVSNSYHDGIYGASDNGGNLETTMTQQINTSFCLDYKTIDNSIRETHVIHPRKTILRRR